MIKSTLKHTVPSTLPWGYSRWNQDNQDLVYVASIDMIILLAMVSLSDQFLLTILKLQTIHQEVLHILCNHINTNACFPNKSKISLNKHLTNFSPVIAIYSLRFVSLYLTSNETSDFTGKKNRPLSQYSTLFAIFLTSLSLPPLPRPCSLGSL